MLPKHWAQLVVAGGLAVAMALLLARCHVIWTRGDVVMPVQLPDRLTGPLE